MSVDTLAAHKAFNLYLIPDKKLDLLQDFIIQLNVSLAIFPIIAGNKWSFGT